MTRIETSRLFYRNSQYWFCPEPFDSSGCSAVYFYAVPTKVDLKGFIREPSPTLLIDLTQDTASLLKNMKKSCRYEVNKAGRSDLLIEKNQHHQAFFDLYRDFVQDKGFSGDLSNYWPLTEQGTLYTCSHQGALLAGLLTLENDTTSRWLISGSSRLANTDDDSRKLTALANRALIWEAMLDARNRGRHWFDFGGVYCGDDKQHPEYGIARFKRSFGGEETTQYKYSRVYSPWLKALKKLKALLQRQ